MKYVYLVYEDNVGLLYVCANKDKATEKVNNIAFNNYGVSKTDEPDYDDEDDYGFEGVACWQRVGVD